VFVVVYVDVGDSYTVCAARVAFAGDSSLQHQPVWGIILKGEPQLSGCLTVELSGCLAAKLAVWLLVSLVSLLAV
jgi:hypothetical protein